MRGAGVGGAHLKQKLLPLVRVEERAFGRRIKRGCCRRQLSLYLWVGSASKASAGHLGGLLTGVKTHGASPSAARKQGAGIATIYALNPLTQRPCPPTTVRDPAKRVREAQPPFPSLYS
jgi:hypothetical protein